MSSPSIEDDGNVLFRWTMRLALPPTISIRGPRRRLPRPARLVESGHAEVADAAGITTIGPAIGESGQAIGPAVPRYEPAALRRVALARSYRDLMAQEGLRQSDLARRFGVTRAAICQLMALLNLAPAVLVRLEAVAGAEGEPHVTERDLRTISKLPTPEAQVAAFEALILDRRAVAK